MQDRVEGSPIDVHQGRVDIAEGFHNKGYATEFVGGLLQWLRATGEVTRVFATEDANDVMYQTGASYDYDPGPDLEKIRAPLLAINSADDLINPPELGILEREIKRVPHGRAIVIPYSAETRGHGTHTFANLWKDELAKLLRESMP